MHVRFIEAFIVVGWFLYCTYCFGTVNREKETKKMGSHVIQNKSDVKDAGAKGRCPQAYNSQIVCACWLIDMNIYLKLRDSFNDISTVQRLFDLNTFLILVIVDCICRFELR